MTNLRDLPQRHLRAVGRRHKDSGQRGGVAAVFGSVADAHREPLAPLDRQREVRLSYCGLDDVLDRADRDAIAGRGFPVHAHVEVGRAGHLFGIDVHSARDRAQRVGDGPGPLLEDVEVVPEDLHADLGPDAGRQHVDAIDDRLGPDVRHAGQRGRYVQLADELVARHPQPPFACRLQIHDGLRHVDRCRVRRRVRPRDLGDDRGDLRKLLQRLVLLPGDLDRLAEADGRIGDRHEHEIAFVQWRHELGADARHQRDGTGHDDESAGQRDGAIPQREVEHGAIQPHQRAHHRVVLFAPNPAADEETAEHGNERHRQDRRPGHGERLGVRERVKQLALLAGEGEHRQERQDDDGEREEDGPAHEPRGVQHRLGDPTAIAGIDAPLLHEAEGVLGHHDAGVHEDADRDGDPRQRHDVGADSEVPHEEKRRQHRERQRNRDDQHRAEVQKEEDVDDRHDDGLLDQRSLQRVHRALDQRRAVVERHEPDASGQPGLKRLDLVLHPVDHVHCADAVAGHHHAAHGFLSALHQRGGPEGVADLHRRHLPDEDGDTVLGADDDVLDVMHVLDQTEPADHRPGPARLDDVAADVAVASHDGVDYGGQRNFVGPQPGGIDVDLVLLDRAADAGDLGDARHGVELVADEPVLDGAKVPQRIAFPLDRVPEDVAHAGGVRPQRGHHAGGKGLRQEIEPFEDAGAREVEIHRILEDHVDHREPERGRRADDTDAGKTLEAHGERIRDLVLDLLRRAARPVGEDDDLVVAEIGDGVDWRRQQRPVPPRADEQEEANHQEAVAQRRLDEPIDHVLGHSLPGRNTDSGPGAFPLCGRTTG